MPSVSYTRVSRDNLMLAPIGKAELARWRSRHGQRLSELGKANPAASQPSAMHATAQLGGAGPAAQRWCVRGGSHSSPVLLDSCQSCLLVQVQNAHSSTRSRKRGPSWPLSKRILGYSPTSTTTVFRGTSEARLMLFATRWTATRRLALTRIGAVPHRVIRRGRSSIETRQRFVPKRSRFTRLRHIQPSRWERRL
jgi:hypothetical protein